jgi:hypothetical protein
VSYVKIDLTKAKEPEVAPEGQYDIRCVKVSQTETKKKEPMTVLTLRIEAGDENYAPVQEFITYPNGGQYDDLRTLTLKRILTAFEVPFDDQGFDTDELLGKTVSVLLVQEEGDDGVIRNRAKWPRVKD